MRNIRTGRGVVVAALCITIVALATPALAGPSMVHGWHQDGTGLLVRGTDGTLEPADWLVPIAHTWAETAPAPGYEDQVPEMERTSDTESLEASEWWDEPELHEWDERRPDDELLRSWEAEPDQDARTEDRYYAYANGWEM